MQFSLPVIVPLIDFKVLENNRFYQGNVTKQYEYETHNDGALKSNLFRQQKAKKKEIKEIFPYTRVDYRTHVNVVNIESICLFYKIEIDRQQT